MGSRTAQMTSLSASVAGRTVSFRSTGTITAQTAGGPTVSRSRLRGLRVRLGPSSGGIGPDQLGEILFDAGERLGVLQERVEPPLHGHEHFIGERPDIQAEF